MVTLTDGVKLIRLLGNSAHVLLEGSQRLTVDEDELPQASPDGETLIRLGGTLLGENLVQLPEDVVLDETRTLSGNVSQARLHGERKADKLVGRVTAPKCIGLPDAEEAVELVHIAHEAMLRIVSGELATGREKTSLTLGRPSPSWW